MASAASATGQACHNCHVRKVKCDLLALGTPPCSRCSQVGVACRRFSRKQRAGRVLRAVMDADTRESPDTRSHSRNPQPEQSANTEQDLEDGSGSFCSLGMGDNPRVLAVSVLGDISKQTSILVDFLSQDFSQGTISDYQVTFNDNYSNITRVLATEFGQGFTDGVYHHRDAPFIKKSHGGLPRTLTAAERGVLELQGAFVLPSRRISDAFVSAFFDRVHPVLPILDRGLFMKHYYSMGSESSELSLLLLQSIFLSGSTSYKHPDLSLPASEVSRRLYTRAKALVENRFEQDRLILVQSHLLFSTYASDSCDDTVQNMWLSIGSAVRIAQGMGMHRSLGKAKASVAMRRQWKRIWWTLFVHDTLCSFEWGRPRAIHLDDCDVELLETTDFDSEEPGALQSAEQTHFFRSICELCFIIVEWLDLLRPGSNRDNYRHPRQSKQDAAQKRISRTRELISSLSLWHQELPAILKPPASQIGFSMWSATLHIAYCAAMLRFTALLPDSTDLVYDMANQITKTCVDLNNQDLLYSLWNFGVHEFDLAMGQHARRVNSKNKDTSALGLQSLKLGLPLMKHLSERNSVASQGTMFYEMLVSRAEQGRPMDSTENDGDDVVERLVAEQSGIGPEFTPSSFQEWPYTFDTFDLDFPDLDPQQSGHPWGWCATE